MRNFYLLISLLTLTGSSIYAQGTVFPGDANRDGIVDHQDVLPIGFAFGNLGPTREISGDQDIQPYQSNWPGVFPNGINYIHADANGNGLVDILDFITLSQNVGLMNNNNATAAAEMTLPAIPASPFISVGEGEELVPTSISGQTLYIPITVGQSPDGNWLNGLAFTLNYNSTIVSSATFTFSNEWLGETSQAFRFQRTEPNKIKIALTRFGSNPVNDNGRIGILELVIIEDLVGFLPTTPGSGVTVANVNGITAVNGEYLSVSMNDVDLITQPVNALLASTDRPEEEMKTVTTVSPNPTDARVTVTSQEPFERIELIDLTGRIQQLYNGPDLLTWTGQVDDQPAGLYYLRTHGSKGLSVTPLIIK